MFYWEIRQMNTVPTEVVARMLLLVFLVYQQYLALTHLRTCLHGILVQQLTQNCQK